MLQILFGSLWLFYNDFALKKSLIFINITVLTSYNFGDFSLYLKSPLSTLALCNSHSYFWMLMAQSIWDELQLGWSGFAFFRNTVWKTLTTSWPTQQLEESGGPAPFHFHMARHCPSTICLGAMWSFQTAISHEKYCFSLHALITDLGTNIQSYIFISSVLKCQPSKTYYKQDVLNLFLRSWAFSVPRLVCLLVQEWNTAHNRAFSIWNTNSSRGPQGFRCLVFNS